MSESDISEAVERAAIFDPDADPATLAAMLKDEDRNDVGNARRLVARHGHDLLHVGGAGWHVWDGTRWRADPDGHAVTRRAFDTVEGMQDEVEAVRAAADEQLRSGVIGEKAADRLVARAAGWATESGNQRRISPMIRLAEPTLGVSVDEMDAQPFLVNVANGTLRLDADGDGGDPVRLVPPDRSHRLTRTLAVACDPDAECPRFDAFLERVVPDCDVRQFLMRYFGYALTGDTREQMVLMLLGGGANGKSTLVNVMETLFGEYGLVLPAKSLLHDDRSGGSGPSPDLAMLPGRRLAMASEPDTGARLSEGMIKQLTGGERMVARQLRERFFDFRPQAKLVFSFNNRPAIKGVDDGIWRRIALVRFAVKIPPHERDGRYVTGEIFRDEMPGILNRILDGYRLWRERGLAPPRAVSDATASYRMDEDRMGAFLAQCTREGEGLRCGAGTLFRAYEVWCRDNAVDPISQNLFGRLMTERGHERVKIGTYYYRNIELLDAVDDPAGTAAPNGPAGG